jgi:hypothetical protein
MYPNYMLFFFATQGLSWPRYSSSKVSNPIQLYTGAYQKLKASLLAGIFMRLSKPNLSSLSRHSRASNPKELNTGAQS